MVSTSTRVLLVVFISHLRSSFINWRWKRTSALVFPNIFTITVWVITVSYLIALLLSRAKLNSYSKSSGVEGATRLLCACASCINEKRIRYLQQFTQLSEDQIQFCLAVFWSCNVRKHVSAVRTYCICDKNQLDALYILSLFRQSTSTCFGNICSLSSGGILYIYNNWYGLCPQLVRFVLFGRLSVGQQTVNWKAQHM